MHAKSWQLEVVSRQYIDVHVQIKQLQDIPVTALSSAICLTMVPLKLKKIFILCVHKGRHRWLVCVSLEKTCCSVCVPRAQPIILQGKEL